MSKKQPSPVTSTDDNGEKPRKAAHPSPPIETAVQARLADPGEQNSRERLLHAALAVFGEKGYDAASTRQIAERAGVNLAAIPYYFGSKENLYRCAINALVDFASARFLTARQRIEEELNRAPRPIRIRELLGEYLAVFLATTAGEEVNLFSPFFLREQMQPGSAFDILYERVINPAHATVSGLIARLTGLPPESRECLLRAHALLGQAFGFLTGRNVILRRLGTTAYCPADIAQAQRIIAENVRALFPLPAPKGDLHE